ncbi:MAG: NYN domain-containing protein [Anaerolineaceae bacterium]|nr:NYN domain-containing protein [Anaerolineaceae bacterium]
MNLIIDGHNLIPHLPGITLRDIDDEEKLIRWLLDYCRTRKVRINVYFDQAAQNGQGSQSFGAVKAHFVQKGITADDAIVAAVKKLGGSARNYKVVSNDRMVISAAKSMHAEVMLSSDFARELVRLSEESPEIDPRNKALTQNEVEEWEEMFSNRKHPHK